MCICVYSKVIKNNRITALLEQLAWEWFKVRIPFEVFFYFFILQTNLNFPFIRRLHRFLIGFEIKYNFTYEMNFLKLGINFHNRRI